VVPRITIIEIIAFVFAVFTLYGCGAEAVLYGVVLLVLGIPVYVWQQRRASEQRQPSEAIESTAV
jgi:arginine:agmatine antiporter